MGNFQRIAVVLLMIMSPDANKSSDTEHPVWHNREIEAICFPECQKLLSKTTAPPKKPKVIDKGCVWCSRLTSAQLNPLGLKTLPLECGQLN